MERFLLAAEAPGRTGRGPIGRMHAFIERGFERLRDAHSRALQGAMRHRRAFVATFSVFAVASLTLVPLLGQDFFPSVDAGQIRLHVRAQAGMRIEQTQRVFAEVEERVRRIIPPDELDVVIDDISVPMSGINLALGDHR